MGVAFLVTKVAFLTFFALNGWNILQDASKQTAKFKTNYKTLEKTVKTRTGAQIPAAISSAAVNKNADSIVMGLGWAQIALAAGTLFVSGMLAIPLGLVYFVQQLVHLNAAGLSLKTPLIEVEQFALALSLLMACFMLAYYSASCTICSVAKRVVDSQLSDVESRSKDKKRN